MYLFNHIVRPNSSGEIEKSTVKIPSVKTALAGSSGLSGKKTGFTSIKSCPNSVYNFFGNMSTPFLL
jgi:hypothetical protein